MKIFIKIIIFVCVIGLFNVSQLLAENKIRIGLLVPITGEHKEIGKSIIKSMRLAVNKIDNSLVEIIPKDTKSKPETTLRSAKELYAQGIRIIIGPVFNKNLIYLDQEFHPDH